MIIAIAGGHRGAGRTTVATDLALTLMQTGRTLGLAGRVALVDADVEQPATDLLLRPLIRERGEVSILLPRVNERCTGQGRCAEVCRFHAIALYAGRPVISPELCCGCGLCLSECPEEALDEDRQPLGRVQMGRVGSMTWVGGRLDVGASWPRPLIGEAIRRATRRAHDVVIIDGPAGAGPAALEAMRAADLALVVVEPSALGLAVLQRTLSAVREHLSLPVVVAINKRPPGAEVGAGADLVAYCRQERVPIMARIDIDARAPSARARGAPLVAANPERLALFQALYRALGQGVSA
jgi:MinD superfamily P-loop ATPase